MMILRSDQIADEALLKAGDTYEAQRGRKGSLSQWFAREFGCDPTVSAELVERYDELRYGDATTYCLHRKRYATKREASEIALKFSRRCGERGLIRIRCERCAGWHLVTSRGKKAGAR
jgi:hypothetical protein